MIKVVVPKGNAVTGKLPWCSDLKVRLSLISDTSIITRKKGLLISYKLKFKLRFPENITIQSHFRTVI